MVFKLIITTLEGSNHYDEVSSLKGSDHRVFFQNAEGNINMGVLFNDPDIGFDDICWYNTMAGAMENSLIANEGLISIDKELKTYSCYVELHRNVFINLVTISYGHSLV